MQGQIDPRSTVRAQPPDPAPRLLEVRTARRQEPGPERSDGVVEDQDVEGVAGTQPVQRGQERGARLLDGRPVHRT